MTEPVKFETTRGTRISEKAIAFFFFIFFTPMAAMLSCLAGVFLLSAVGAPIVLAVMANIVLPLLIARYAWKRMMSRLRFCIQLGQERVDIGRGWARCSISLDDVDMVSIVLGKNPCVFIQGPKVRARVFLTADVAQACADALRMRCQNAVYVDANNIEYLPAESRRPLRNLLLVQRRCLKIAMGLTALVPISLALTIGSIAVLYQRAQGIPNESRVTIGMLVGGFLSPLLAWQAWKYFQKARKAQEVRALLAAEGVRDS
jgi:hypothetical protein